MRKILFLMLLALPLAGCNEDEAKQAIEANGFKNVSLTGMPFYGCDKNDNAFYNQLFTATAQDGKRVEGVACGGILKGYTVRIRRVL